MTFKLLVVDDDTFQAKTVQLAIEKMLKYDVVTCGSGQQAIDLLLSEEGSKIDLVILDLSMPEIDGIEVLDKVCPHRPDLPIIINTAYGDIKKAVNAIKKGAIDFIEKNEGPDRLKVSIENIKLLSRLNKEVKKLQRFSNNKFQFKDIIGESDQLKKAINSAKRASQSNIPVLLNGESGVGKEMFARAIHAASTRENKPFIAVNCGAIPQNLVESVLFGHEKGSFTGAIEKSIGKFRDAEGGTIFLDEVGELPLESQIKLLRALQNFEVEPVGSSKPIDVNIRIISATNKNLERAVAEGKFREDLYYRLNVFQLEIPPLRQRKDDIPLLAKHFVEKICMREKKRLLSIDDALISMLKEYWWPGNIRQLENSIYRAVILANNETLSMYDFENILAAISGNKDSAPNQITSEIAGNIGYTSNVESKFKTISEHEKDVIERALEFYNYNITKVSKILDVGRSTLYRKMKEYNIEMKGSLEELEEFKKSKGS